MQQHLTIESAVDFVDAVIGEGLWHTTSCERYTQILQSGKISVNPDISDQVRHKTSNGPANYPYVRHLGGVSLFDFSVFQADRYEQCYPISTWRYFVPTTGDADTSIWILLDRLKIQSSLIRAECLLAKWKAESAYSHTFMPLIEAAHVGDIPAAHFLKVLRVSKVGYAYVVSHEENV